MNTKHLPLVVDLDGTHKTDMLLESFFYFVRYYPHKVFKLLSWLYKRKTGFKE